MSNKNSVWVCLEQTGGKIAGVSYEMLSGARKLANELSGEVCAVLMGHQVQAQAKEAFAYGADKVYVCDNENLEHYNTGAYCKVLEKLVKENEPEILLLAATTNGRDLAGRLASRLETGLAADCTALALEDGQLVATRPTYGGNIMAEVVFPEKRPAMCTIRGNAMSKDDPDASKTGEVITVAYDVDDAELRTKVKEIIAKASGPVTAIGNLLDHANVQAGEALLYLGSSTIDSQIRSKQEEINSAQTKLDEAQKALNDFNAVAPIDGTVTSCNLTPGQEVKSGDTVVMISNNVTMLVTITVDDRNISFIKPGNYVDLDWNGQVYQGLVTSIDMGGAQAGQGMTSYPVTLTVDNVDGSLMDGAWLQYSFVTSESADCILVPTTSVKYFSDMDSTRQSVVFVKRDSRPDDVPELELPEVAPGEKRTFPSEEEGYYPVIVETGISDTQNVEIVSGIQEGDEVFVNYTVTDGSYGY